MPSPVSPQHASPTVRHDLAPTGTGQPARTRGSIWVPLGWTLFVVGLVAAMPISIYRAVNDTGGTDFPEFYAAGRYVLEHREVWPTEFLKYYWPSLDVAWAGLAWLPLLAAAALWYVFNVATWLGLLGAIHRYLLDGVAEPYRRHAVLSAGLLMTPLVLDHLCLGAFHLLMVWLMVWGLGRIARGRDWSGGALLGLAIWVKLLPLLGVGYLVLKRRWRPALVALGCAIAVDAALALPVFGPQRTWELHQRWWENQATGATHRTLTLRESISEDRLTNQSPIIIMRRVLTQLGTYPDCPWLKVAVGDLSPRQFRAAYLAVTAILGLVVLVVCRRPSRTTSESRWSTEIAFIVLATLWFSPVAWSYHPTAATPALAVVLARKQSYPRLAWVTALVWLAAMALMGSDLARAVGEMLWTTIFLGTVLVATDPRTATASELTHR